MPKIAATVVESISGSQVTADGGHMVMTLRTKDVGDVALAFTREQIAPLIDHGALSLSRSDKTLCAEPEKTAVSWWNSSRDAASGEFTLALTFGGGGTLSFALSEHMARALLKTLRGHYEADRAEDRPLSNAFEADLPAPGFIDID